MTLIINSEEVMRVLNMKDCIDAMEEVFAEEARGIAVNHPRQRYRAPRHTELNQRGYMANMIAGAVPSRNVAAIRYDSAIIRERIAFGKKRMDWLYPSRRNWGFVLLFSLETGEPLAIIHDFTLSPIRVGATTGVAIRMLARENAARVGLFGSGRQAERSLEAICQVRKVETVNVFSPNRVHREEFAEKMSKRLGVSIRPVETPREAVQGMDIVMCATSASEPVFDGNWLEPGQVVTTISNTDGVHRYRTEADSTTFLRSDLIVLNSKETVFANQQRELLDLIDEGKFGWEKVTEVGKVLIKEHPGRTDDRQLIYYKSNTGVGIQFAAAGALIYEAARKEKLGREIPTEWLGTDVGELLDKGFDPAP